MKDKILEALRGYFAAGLLAKDTDTRAWMGEDDQGPIHIDLSALASHIAAALEEEPVDPLMDKMYRVLKTDQEVWRFLRTPQKVLGGMTPHQTFDNPDSRPLIGKLLDEYPNSTPDPTHPEGQEGR